MKLWASLTRYGHLMWVLPFLNLKGVAFPPSSMYYNVDPYATPSYRSGITVTKG